MVLALVLSFAVALTLSLVLTPQVIRLAGAVGAIDQPDPRKVHSRPIPRFGGVGVYISFLGALLVLVAFNPRVLENSWITGTQGLGFILGLFIIHVTGIVDDIVGLSASRKFLVQFLVANIVYFTGTHVNIITSPFGDHPFQVGWLNYPITVMWMVGVTNAFNLIDGLDGLASGVGVIAFLSIFPIALFNNDPASAVIALLLSGALVGFLRYNVNPARVFLGDSGSLLLGFTLSFVAIQSSTKGTAAFALLAPVLALGLPIMDTLLSMSRRFLRSFLPDEVKPGSPLARLVRMFKPDRGHIHHRLLARGLSHRRAVVVMYSVSCLLGLGALGVTVTNNLTAALILVIIGMASFLGVRKLRYREMSVMSNGLLLPLYDKPIMNRDSFQGFLDIAFMNVAFLGSLLLTDHEELDALLTNSALTSLIITVGVQFVVFTIAGMYRGTFRLNGINDVLKAIRSTVFAVVASSVALTMISQTFNTMMLVGFMLNLFFLLTMVLSFRSSQSILQYLFRQEARTSDRRLLIYGADQQGLLVLDKIIRLGYSGLVPVGFIDDDPAKEGRMVNGYPVFGGHYRIAALHEKMQIHEIVLAADTIMPEALRQLRRFTDQHRIKLTKLRFEFEDLGHPTRKAAIYGVPSRIMQPELAAGVHHREMK